MVITPSLTLSDFHGVLSNLQSSTELAAKLRMMERATWEAASLIRARMDVQHALDACCESLNAPLPTLSRVPSRIYIDPSAQHGGLGASLGTMQGAGCTSTGGAACTASDGHVGRRGLPPLPEVNGASQPMRARVSPARPRPIPLST